MHLCSWDSHHNSVAFTLIFLYTIQGLSMIIFQLQTYFQLTPLSGLPGRREN